MTSDPKLTPTTPKITDQPLTTQTPKPGVTFEDPTFNKAPVIKPQITPPPTKPSGG